MEQDKRQDGPNRQHRRLLSTHQNKRRQAVEAPQLTRNVSNQRQAVQFNTQEEATKFFATTATTANNKDVQISIGDVQSPRKVQAKLVKKSAKQGKITKVRLVSPQRYAASPRVESATIFYEATQCSPAEMLLAPGVTATGTINSSRGSSVPKKHEALLSARDRRQINAVSKANQQQQVTKKKQHVNLESANSIGPEDKKVRTVMKVPALNTHRPHLTAQNNQTPFQLNSARDYSDASFHQYKKLNLPSSVLQGGKVQIDSARSRHQQAPSSQNEIQQLSQPQQLKYNNYSGLAQLTKKLKQNKIQRQRQPSAPQHRPRGATSDMFLQQNQVIQAWQENKHIFMNKLLQKEALERLKHDPRPAEALNSDRSNHRLRDQQPSNLFHHRYITHDINEQQSQLQLGRLRQSNSAGEFQQILACSREFNETAPKCDKCHYQKISQFNNRGLQMAAQAHSVSSSQLNSTEDVNYKNRGFLSQADIAYLHKKKKKKKERMMSAKHPEQQRQQDSSEKIQLFKIQRHQSMLKQIRKRKRYDIQSSVSNSSGYESLTSHERFHKFGPCAKKDYQNILTSNLAKAASSSSSGDLSLGSSSLPSSGQKVSVNRLDKIILQRLKIIQKLQNEDQRLKNTQKSNSLPQSPKNTTQNVNSRAPTFMNSTINTVTINSPCSCVHHHNNFALPQHHTLNSGPIQPIHHQNPAHVNPIPIIQIDQNGQDRIQEEKSRNDSSNYQTQKTELVTQQSLKKQSKVEQQPDANLDLIESDLEVILPAGQESPKQEQSSPLVSSQHANQFTSRTEEQEEHKSKEIINNLQNTINTNQTQSGVSVQKFDPNYETKTLQVEKQVNSETWVSQDQEYFNMPNDEEDLKKHVTDQSFKPQNDSKNSTMQKFKKSTLSFIDKIGIENQGENKKAITETRRSDSVSGNKDLSLPQEDSKQNLKEKSRPSKKDSRKDSIMSDKILTAMNQELQKLTKDNNVFKNVMQRNDFLKKFQDRMIEVTQHAAPPSETNEKKPKSKAKLLPERKLQRRGTVVPNFKPEFFKIQEQKTETHKAQDKTIAPSLSKTVTSVNEKNTRKTFKRLQTSLVQKVPDFTLKEELSPLAETDKSASPLAKVTPQQQLQSAINKIDEIQKGSQEKKVEKLEKQEVQQVSKMHGDEIMSLSQLLLTADNDDKEEVSDEIKNIIYKPQATFTEQKSRQANSIVNGKASDLASETDSDFKSSKSSIINVDMTESRNPITNNDDLLNLEKAHMMKVKASRMPEFWPYAPKRDVKMFSSDEVDFSKVKIDHLTDTDQKNNERISAEIQNFRNSTAEQQNQSQVFKVWNVPVTRKTSIVSMYLPEEIKNPTVSSHQIIAKENSLLEIWETQKRRKKAVDQLRESTSMIIGLDFMHDSDDKKRGSQYVDNQSEKSELQKITEEEGSEEQLNLLEEPVNIHYFLQKGMNKGQLWQDNMMKLTKKLNFNWHDTELNFLEHIYFRPQVETKYFLKLKEESTSEKIQHVSGFQIMQKLELFGMHDFELLFQKVVKDEFRDISVNINDFLKKIGILSDSNANQDQQSDFEGNNLQFNEIKLPSSFFLQEFDSYNIKIQKLGISKVADMPKTFKIAQAKKEFTKHLINIDREDMFSFITKRINKASRKLKRLKEPRRTPAEIIKRNERNRHKIVTFNANVAAKKAKQSLKNSDFVTHVQFNSDQQSHPQIQNIQSYNNMKQLVNIQSMNYYILGKKFKENTAENRLLDRKYDQILAEKKQAIILAASPAALREQMKRERYKQSQFQNMKSLKHDSSTSDEEDCNYKRQRALLPSDETVERVESAEKQIEFYDQKDSYKISEQLIKIMPQTNKDKSRFEQQSKYRVTRMIEYFAMKTIFLKIPNFEPLMEIFEADRLSKSSLQQNTLQFYRSNKRYKGIDQKKLTFLEKSMTLRLGSGQNIYSKSFNQRESVKMLSECVHDQQRANRIISLKLGKRNNEEDNQSLNTNESLDQIQYSDVLGFFARNEEYTKRAQNVKSKIDFRYQRMPKMPYSHTVLLKSLQTDLTHYQQDEYFGENDDKPTSDAQVANRNKNITEQLVVKKDAIDNIIQLKIDLFNTNQVLDFVEDIEQEARQDNVKMNQFKKKLLKEQRKKKQQDKSAEEELKRGSFIEFPELFPTLMHRTHETISSSGIYNAGKKQSAEFALDPRIRKLSNNVAMNNSQRDRNGTPQSANASIVKSENKKTGQYLKIDDCTINFKPSKTYIDDEDNQSQKITSRKFNKDPLMNLDIEEEKAFSVKINSKQLTDLSQKLNTVTHTFTTSDSERVSEDKAKQIAQGSEKVQDSLNPQPSPLKYENQKQQTMNVFKKTPKTKVKKRKSMASDESESLKSLSSEGMDLENTSRKKEESKNSSKKSGFNLNKRDSNRSSSTDAIKTSYYSESEGKNKATKAILTKPSSRMNDDDIDSFNVQSSEEELNFTELKVQDNDGKKSSNKNKARIKFLKQEVFKKEKIPKQNDKVICIPKCIDRTSQNKVQDDKSGFNMNQLHKDKLKEQDAQRNQRRINKVIQMIMRRINEDFIVQQIEQYNYKLDQTISDDGLTLLMLSVKNGLNRVTEYISRRQSDVNMKDRNGNTALHHAFLLDFRDQVDILIDNGADEYIENQDGLRPWELTENKNTDYQQNQM